jgi:ubiquinone/menaquinone biosynthesis C-methylase UbiE
MKLVASHPHVQFIGVEPAANMRKLADARAADYPNARILEGRFESLPLETHSVDYLYSILAFHWTSDLDKSVAELARIPRPTGEMDLTFIGRHNGREFIQKTTPVFFKYGSSPARQIAPKLNEARRGHVICGILPICCRKLSASNSTHSSATRPSTKRVMPIAVHFS